MRAGRAFTCGLLILLLTPSLGQAQWVEPPGEGWAQLQVVHHDTQTRFGPMGDIEPLFNEDSRSITTSVLITAALGLIPGVDAWGDVPFHHLQFNDVVRDRTSTGIGDPRMFLRVGPEAFGIETLLPIAVRGGVKFPVGDVPIDAEIIPLTEGQRDWELLLELGAATLDPAPIYAMVWVGYRWRETNTEIERKPGDERILHAAVGGSLGDFTWKMAVDGLFGRPPVRTRFDITLENDKRRFVQLLPTVGWQVGPGAVELGGRIPLDGRNLPAGPAITLGYFLSWDDPLW